MNTDIKKTALITGGSKGLGKAVAIQLAETGNNLILVGRSEEDLESLKKEVEQKKIRCDIIVADLSDPTEVKACITKIKQQERRPSIIVHNAGGSLKVTDTFADAEVWQKVWYFNVGAGIDINNAFIESMRQDAWGRIVHVTSISAFTYKGYGPYVSAKCALVGYVKSLSRQVAPQGIVVSAVAPGPIAMPGRYLTVQQEQNTEEWKTFCREQLAIGKLASPAEIASAVTYLCSESASYAAGTIINIDGGTL